MTRTAFRYFIAALLALLMLTPAHARRKKSLPTVDWGLSTAAGFMYDDNVLGFSESDQNRYLRDQGAFPTPLETIDDLESSLSVKPSLRWRAPWTLMVDADYRLKAVHRLRNGFSDYQTHTAGISVRPRIQGYRWTARARVTAMPSFYLRAYRDRDYQAYHATRYSHWDYSGTLRVRVTDPMWLEVGASYGTYYYNRKFTEFDSEYRDMTIGGTYQTPWEIDISAGYTRRFSENVGYSPTFPVIGESDVLEDTEYGDADYHEDDVTASVRTAIPWIRVAPTDAGLAFRYRRRVYTTDRELIADPFHRGRLDNRGQWTFSVRTFPARRLGLEGSFSYEYRASESKEPAVALAKDFIRREMGITLTYEIR